METLNVSFDNSKPFSSVGLVLPAIHFTSIYPITAYYILYPEQKTFTNYCALFPLQNKQFRPLEVCSLDDLWSFAASHSLKHFINRCTWKSSQYYIIISRMTSFIRMSQKLVFHQSKSICAIKRILSTTAMYVSLPSFMYLRIACYCDACLNSSALLVGVMTLLNTINKNVKRFPTARNRYVDEDLHCLPGNG